MTPHLPEPESPTSRNSRTFKGESIRSLRELLQATLSASTSSLPDDRDDHNDGKQQPEQIHPSKVGLTRVEEDVADFDETEPQQDKNDGAPPMDDATKAKLALQESSRRAADEVRSRLLKNLGIQKQLDPAITANPSNPAPSSEPWGDTYPVTLNDLPPSLRRTAPIINASTGNSTSTNGESTTTNNKTTTTTTTTTTTDSGTKAKRAKLEFNPSVKVIPIPSHKVYSNRIKQTIWAGVAELEENVARNSLEFSYENWNADDVLDEESGLIYNQGEWIHPVHFDLPPDYYPNGGGKKQQLEDMPLSSDDIWKQTCERLGIQPAEYYHTVLPTAKPKT